MKVSEGSFCSRHIGLSEKDTAEILASLGLRSTDELISAVVPDKLRFKGQMKLPAAATEFEALFELKSIIDQNELYRSFIGQGFYGTITPSVIRRCILENPGWYTSYTPYQAEISQGRLEALLNYQTLVSDLTGLPFSNSSLLDEGSAAAEAMALLFRARSEESNRTFFLHRDSFDHVKKVIHTRAIPMGIEVVEGSFDELAKTNGFAAFVQTPNRYGELLDPTSLITSAKQRGVRVIVGTDLLALTLMKNPASMGADVAIGNSQRFGVPLWMGGPHAAFMAVTEEFTRDLPGRLVGVSKDRSGKPALRLTLQTREQHIKRERATSNICTAQVLLAVMAGMYATYHGPHGLKRISKRIGASTKLLRSRLEAAGLKMAPGESFDTLSFKLDAAGLASVLERAERARGNLFVHPQGSDYQLSLSLDERTSPQELGLLEEILTGKTKGFSAAEVESTASTFSFSTAMRRSGDILHHSVFNSYHSETELMRYIDRLERKDYSLTDSMIPLGSCTMKLNAASELLPVAWTKNSEIHPFVPAAQAKGYKIMSNQLESWLAEITGMAGTSLQPNAGSQGEYAGLLAIRGYLQAKGETRRDTLIIPTSAHGTNPASAVMAGFKVAAVGCRENGDINVEELRTKISELGPKVAGIMITYPSTHGVFEETLPEIVSAIHDAGGQVYMDGANFNALTGLVRPGDVGVDVMHLNLHKTFCIPHGGGGPGVGPICVQKHLLPFLASNKYAEAGHTGDSATMVASADLGSAGILVIPWMYIRMMGAEGLTAATTAAILSANYISTRLSDSFETLYSQKGYVAHECILDCRAFKRKCGIDVTDIAKRLMDFGFHAPTVSWPVAETLMVEPTESESKAELDRFCEAMIRIRAEIADVESGKRKPEESPLRNSPHTVETLSSDEWVYPYSREDAAYPLSWLRERKLWPSVSRIDNAWGDRNLFCACGD